MIRHKNVRLGRFEICNVYLQCGARSYKNAGLNDIEFFYDTLSPFTPMTEIYALIGHIQFIGIVTT